LAPAIATDAPTIPAVGAKLEIVGPPSLEATVKFAVLVTVTAAVVTEIGPVVAAAGTVTTNCVDVAELTVAVVPLNLTVLELAVVLKPVPTMATWSPTTPRAGRKLVMESVPSGTTLVDVMLPVAS
jgi:hypothetical protein